MATAAKGSREKVKNQEMAARMKLLGIRRTSGVCPICYRIVSVPMDRHFFGGICK
jgi:hypothetical protein